MKKRLVIDRFEGNFAILVDDDEKTYNVDKNLFLNNKEKDIIYIESDEEAKRAKLNEVEDLMNRLFED